MKIPFTIILLLTLNFCFSQTSVDWSFDYQLDLSDFDSNETEINNELTTYSISSGAQIDFSFEMSTYQFMFTKNFNKKVKTVFNKKSAVIVAPDSLTAIRLVRVGQYGFDLTELYSRKFRKEIYEKKGAFSGVSFFKPIFNDLQDKMNAENARVMKTSNLGENQILLKQEHDKILQEIDKLSDFCFDCKPLKKRKRKKKKKD